MDVSGNPTRLESVARPDPLAWVKDRPYFQGGLAGYSDLPMRLIARRHGCPFCVTEAMLDMLLLRGGRGLRIAYLEDEDHPIAGQLIGSDPGEMAQAAKLLLKMGYDAIDLNLACPVKKLRRKFRGGHLMSTPEQAIAICDAVKQAVGDDAPVMVKLRRGYDDKPSSTADFHRIFQAVIGLKFAAACVHPRSVKQKYVGPSRWAFLAELVKTYPGFCIFGSGDVFSPQAIFDMIRQTGVAAVSVARGGIGNPWVFEQAAQIGRGETPMVPTIAQQRQVLAEHFELALKTHGPRLAGKMMRKFGIMFSRLHPQRAEVAKGFIAVHTLVDWQAVLERFYGEEGSGP